MNKIIIAIVVVLILGYVGANLSKKSVPAPVQNTPEQSAASSTPETKKEETKTAPMVISKPKITPAYNMMQVPELGIVLPIQKDVKDLMYSVSNGKLYITRSSFVELSPACQAKQAPFGFIERIAKADLVSDPNGYWTKTVEGIEHAKQNGLVKDFGKFYFVFISPQDATCTLATGAKPPFFSFDGLSPM